MFGVDLIYFIITIGYIGLFGIIFAESGLFIGFFLPGDSLLFTAGFLASQKILNIAILLPLTFVAAVIGDSFGYTFGRRVGYKLFRREDSIFFHKDHLEKARAFYEKHGGKTIIIARFIPVVRTFAPILAGVGKMQYSTFLFFNVIGAIIWAIGVTMLGYFLGNAIPGIDKYLLPIIVFIILVSILPGIIHVLKNKEDRAKIARLLKDLLFKRK